MKTVLDQQVCLILDRINKKMQELGHPSLDVLTPEESRYFYKEARKFFIGIAIHDVFVKQEVIQCTGYDLPIRIYTPKGEGPFPVLLYFHGGGWVFGDLDSCDQICRYISKHAECLVLSVGYRLSPENKYPAAIEDAISSLSWTFNHISSLNGRLDRVCVGGESSGGNIATACALKWKEINNLPIHSQLLITPVTNHACDTPSFQADYSYNLTKEKMVWFWSHYLKNEEEGFDQYASPLRAESLIGMPKTLLITAELDPLRDEGKLYAKRLQEQLIEVDYVNYPGLVHSFINMIGEAETAKRAVDDIVERFRELIECEGE
ncbi:alpha/beta hydrolase [Bacillus sp. IB182487]|uniref:Alpha/beta hydrolase n=1 Tax=Metabacillus arenae TaxID=2771434 RepID=A0A926NAF1_9BACI|nr:alpha/beta hydrolase [Metabacillus arenae]